MLFIRAHRFPQKVLIATSVIDNGISLYDSDLKSIVIDFFDHTQIMQMIGRRRLGVGESIDVYLKIPSLDEINRRINDCRLRLDSIADFRQAPNVFFKQKWGSLDENMQRLFCPTSPNEDNEPVINQRGLLQVFSINSFCEYQLSVLEEEYQKLHTEMRFDQYAYAKNACHWFEQEFTPDMIIERTYDDMRDDINNIWTEKANSQNALTVSELENFLEANLELLTQDILKELNLTKSGSDRGDHRVPEKLRRIIDKFDLSYEIKKLKKKELEERGENSSLLYCIQVLEEC